MNKNELVSIIVPIYNVEQYIRRCVNSLIEQEHKNIEIILVDDGSPDNAPNIIDELAKKDKRIVVIHKNNGGVSSARNIGIENAHGSYIMFVDGDDWVEPSYVAYFLNLVNNNSCSIGMNKNNFSEICNKSSNKEYVISKDMAAESIYRGEIFVAVWNKIYSKKLLDEYKICFREDIWYGEGMLFNIDCLQYISKVAVGEKAVYHQTTNPNSAMRSFSLESNFCGIKSMEIQKEICNKFSHRVRKAWSLHRYYYNRSIIDGLVRTKSIDKNKSIYKRCIKQIRVNINIPLIAEKNIKRRIVWIAYFVAPRLASEIITKKYQRDLQCAINSEKK